MIRVPTIAAAAILALTTARGAAALDVTETVTTTAAPAKIWELLATH